MSLRRLAAFAAACSITLPAFSATDFDVDDTVTVTATRTPLVLADALAPVIVITGDELRRTATFDLAEALRFHAGIEIGRNGGPGQAASLFLRGTNSNHTQVLIDGVRINPGTLGGAAIHHLRPADIERIEIVKGPRSTLYGTEAIGGVINVITRRAQAPLALEAEAGAGAYGTRSAGAGVRGRRGEWHAGLRADALAADGFPPRADGALDRGYDNRTLHARVGRDAGAFRAEIRSWQAAGNVEYVDFFGAPLDQDFSNRLTAVELEWDTDARRTLLRASRAGDEIRQRQSPDHVRTDRTTLDWQTDWRLAGAHELTAGATLSRERTVALLFGAGFDERPDTRAAFTQWRFDDGGTRALAAVRYSDHDAFGDTVNFNVEVGRALDARWDLIAAAGSAYRAPDSTQRFGVAGNPDLRPERSRNIEFGLRGKFGDHGRLAWQLYENRIEDLVTFDGATFALANIDRARIRGSELSYTHDAGRWYWRQSLILQQPLDRATGDPFPRRARRTMQSAVAWRAGDALRVGADLLATGPRKDSGFSPDYIPGYVLVSLSAEWEVTRAWTLDARLENALDADYETALGFAQAGRSLFVRLRWAGW